MLLVSYLLSKHFFPFGNSLILGIIFCILPKPWEVSEIDFFLGDKFSSSLKFLFVYAVKYRLLPSFNSVELEFLVWDLFTTPNLEQYFIKPLYTFTLINILLIRVKNKYNRNGAVDQRFVKILVLTEFGVKLFDDRIWTVANSWENFDKINL